MGQGDKTWRAYLSVERDSANNNKPTNARDRIGNGPWFNANRLMVGKDLTDLHERKGNPILFVDERGQPVPGAWPGSPKPNEHDILTGSTAKVESCQGKPATTGRQNLPTCRRKWVTLTVSGLVAIPREPPVRGTRRMRVEAAPIPPPAEVQADSTASRRSKSGALMATSCDQFTH